MTIFFFLFAGLLVLSSICVIISKNPVYSILWLIFAFCNSAGLMILMGAEFLAMMLIIIYVGAVAVLFLFVIMMLDVNFAELKGGLKKNLSLGIVVGLIMFVDLVAIILIGTKAIAIKDNQGFVIQAEVSNSHAIGQRLYTDFILPFQTAGIILFVAMVACIALTLRYREGVKRQEVAKQLAKNKENSLFLEKPVVNSGIKGINYE